MIGAELDSLGNICNFKMCYVTHVTFGTSSSIILINHMNSASLKMQLLKSSGLSKENRQIQQQLHHSSDQLLLM